MHSRTAVVVTGVLTAILVLGALCAPEAPRHVRPFAGEKSLTP
ncbi:hypothetical protein [Nonomuraea aridisoli]|nr:hypothetical protein [Nonomuraea aridisoli]